MTLPSGRYYAVELHVSAERVSQIRRIVAAHLRHWNLELHIQPVCRGVEELLTNVHRHVGDDNRCVVELRWTGRHLTASVADNGPPMPRLVSAGGGGLAVVARLCDSWGTCGTADGKVVWFTRRVADARNSPLVPCPPVPGVGDAKGQPAPAPEPVTAPSPAPPRTLPPTPTPTPTPVPVGVPVLA
ncbi:ATP-binding protein [Streptomyces sp. ISL-99]|uniref:ATP-binding protein n=1 Tax=Streptomyces sp. ISL-99 TaxID=2819193 RepID=UPI001BE5A901|nr:ATP-binding protein [Streptomyces sp. ISL-99]MBT2525091.1 ATP-binding protein [Streptomyces sp. ISL-99]